MKYMNYKPQLDSLSLRDRIAFVRQFRNLTQDEVSEKLGLTSENKRRTMERYENDERVPKEDRLNELASILNVNSNCIKEYNFKNKEDLVYFLLWLEEIFPKMNIDFAIPVYTVVNDKTLSEIELNKFLEYNVN